MAGAFRICTTRLTTGQSLLIASSMNVFNISYKMSSTDGDSATVTGNLTIQDSLGNDIVSEDITIPAGDVNAFGSGSAGQPLDGITIRCVSGTLSLFLGQS